MMGPPEGGVGVRASSGRKGSEKKGTHFHQAPTGLTALSRGRREAILPPLEGDGQAVVSLP